jgi:hypothetical protein
LSYDEVLAYIRDILKTIKNEFRTYVAKCVIFCSKKYSNTGDVIVCSQVDACLNNHVGVYVHLLSVQGKK